MDRLEVKESPKKNLFWALACLIMGGFFLYSAVFYDSLGKLGLGLGGSFVLGSLLFFWPVFKPTVRLVIDNEGIWTHTHKTKILWKDVREISIESDMLVLEINDVDLYFPDSSKMSKAILKRVFFDLGRVDTKVATIYDFVLNCQQNEPT